MPGTQLFTSTNNYYQIIGGVNSHRSATQPRVVLGAREEGICMAVTALWCKNVLAGLLTKPDAHRAQIIQARSRINFASPQGNAGVEAFFNELFALVEVAGQRVEDQEDAFLCLSNMGQDPGVYWVWNGPHVIGFRTGADSLLFYDCDENGAGGLWQFNSLGDWQSKVFEYYDRAERWSVWKITDV
jgi:hypothetical protein